MNIKLFICLDWEVFCKVLKTFCFKVFWIVFLIRIWMNHKKNWEKWDVIGLWGMGGERVFWTSSLYFFLLKKIGFASWSDIMPSQTLIYYWEDIFLWIWRDLILLFLFRSFTYTLRLLFHSLFTFSSCANKTGWLQNEY